VWAIGTELDKTVKSIEQKRIRDTDQGGTGLDHYDDNSKVMVVEIRWFEREVFYLIADEETQTKLQISEAQYQHMLKNAKKLEARLPGIQVMPTAARMTRKVYRRAFLGNERRPGPDQGQIQLGLHHRGIGPQQGTASMNRTGKMKQNERKHTAVMAQIHRERRDDKRASAWLAKHSPKTKPKPKPKRQPLERWQIRARAQKQERRALAKPLLKGVE